MRKISWRRIVACWFNHTCSACGHEWKKGDKMHGARCSRCNETFPLCDACFNLHEAKKKDVCPRCTITGKCRYCNYPASALRPFYYCECDHCGSKNFISCPRCLERNLCQGCGAKAELEEIDEYNSNSAALEL